MEERRRSADDVGLGKTIEAGLAMLELLARQRVRRILVVAPPGLLLQWVEGLPVTGDEAGRELLRKVATYCSRTARAAEGTEDDDLVTFAMQIVKKRARSSRAALRKTLEHRLEALKKEAAREQPPSAPEIRDLQADLPLGDAALERMTRKLLRSAIPRDVEQRGGHDTASVFRVGPKIGEAVAQAAR
mgnify:FL=1